MTIRDFRAVRRDGQIITEGMSVEDIIRLGQPEKISELRWLNDDIAVRVPFPEGVLAKVLQSRTHIIALAGNRASVLEPDGQELRELRLGEGLLGWFEPSPSGGPNCIGVVVDRGAKGMRLLDVDVLTGEIVSSRETR